MPRSTPNTPRAALAALALAAAVSCAPAHTTTPPVARTFPDADTTRVTRLAPGVQHTYLWLPAGPWAVHVVEVDEGVCEPEIVAVKAGPPLHARALTSVLGADAIAALNADFFMLPGGTPVGAHVRDGRVLVGPGTRPAWAVDTAGTHRAGRERVEGFAAVPGDTAALTQVNRPVAGAPHHPPRPGLTLFDEWAGDAAPADSAGPTLRLHRVDPAPAAGGGRGVVVSVHPPRETVALDTLHVALQAVGGAAAWLERRAIGDTVRWRLDLVPADGDGAPAVEAVGGFPVLVAGGRGVVAEQEGVIESFGSARHPRTAVGWNPEAGRLLWVVVDGRQEPYSAGMTLAELEWLFLRLGATEALNLDGGGSTALALDGRVANRPSDPEGERAVANVLALRGCRATPGRR